MRRNQRRRIVLQQPCIGAERHQRSEEDKEEQAQQRFRRHVAELQRMVLAAQEATGEEHQRAAYQRQRGVQRRAAGRLELARVHDAD